MSPTAPYYVRTGNVVVCNRLQWMQGNVLEGPRQLKKKAQGPKRGWEAGEAAGDREGTRYEKEAVSGSDGGQKSGEADLGERDRTRGAGKKGKK